MICYYATAFPSAISEGILCHEEIIFTKIDNKGKSVFDVADVYAVLDVVIVFVEF